MCDVSSVCGPYTGYRSGNFDVKYAPCSGRSIVKNIDKIMKIIVSNHHVIDFPLPSLQKAQFMDATSFNVKKPVGTNFHRRIATEL